MPNALWPHFQVFGPHENCRKVFEMNDGPTTGFTS